MRARESKTGKKIKTKSGDKCGETWTTQEERYLIQRVREGKSTSQIARELGVKPQRIQDKRRALGLGPKRNQEMKERNCLVCTEPFESEGIHNRLCEVCRHIAFWP